MTGALYVVATPLGNLGDLSPRAVEVLGSVGVIAAEDTRHSHILCQHWGIHTPLISLHDYNERARLRSLIERLQAGESIAVVSDAGTPLISDPGYLFVRAARQSGIPVYAVAGPSAVIAALSVAGIPCDRFAFEGFPPSQVSARQAFFASLVHETRTLVFYESPHRLSASLFDLSQALGGDREAALIRELTKRYEEGILGSLATLADEFSQRLVKGECVLVVRGAEEVRRDEDCERVLRILLEALPLRQAVDLTVAITGAARKPLYTLALSLKKPQEHS